MNNNTTFTLMKNCNNVTVGKMTVDEDKHSLFENCTINITGKYIVEGKESTALQKKRLFKNCKGTITDIDIKSL